ncbi:helix-turn-helix domain-containing protein [Caballeronia sp. ATUFL_M1_KS5A]|uniref:winged helix-turn-helix transcriptional regulator n=1 Tax=Caballeronia sp. ATUFL_M1_KS5A TaxID=2921778 RepID=UPI002027ED3A|nr:helix-turn-helix domain-containing protein [Caballeronia sp. ATUFL_M1_KS5A]
MRANESTDCPVRGVLDHVGDKWSVLVLLALEQSAGALRFTELKRRVDGVSQRMLTETLRGLERNGTVTRTAYPTIPPKVEYALTEMGASFVSVVRPLVSWAKMHHPQILSARREFDTRKSAQDDR